MIGGFSAVQIQFEKASLKTQNFNKCLEELHSSLRKYGITAQDPQPPKTISIPYPGLQNRNRKPIEQILDRYFRDIASRGIRWLWIAIPYHNALLYTTIKTLSDARYSGCRDPR